MAVIFHSFGAVSENVRSPSVFLLLPLGATKSQRPLGTTDSNIAFHRWITDCKDMFFLQQVRERGRSNLSAPQLRINEFHRTASKVAKTLYHDLSYYEPVVLANQGADRGDWKKSEKDGEKIQRRKVGRKSKNFYHLFRLFPCPFYLPLGLGGWLYSCRLILINFQRKRRQKRTIATFSTR